MNRPLVTALIDTYNYGHFVEQAIESVLEQNYPAELVEVLVVDDGSTDDTGERVKKYGGRVQYLRKENGGQASAFNLGFAQATGEIVALLDADDYWLPGKLSGVARAFEAHPGTGLVYHRRTELNSVTGDSREGNFANCSGYLPDRVADMLAYRVLPTSTLTFHRDVLARLLPMPESIRLQADAYLEVLAVFLAPVVALPETLAVYRLHGNNLFAASQSGAHQEKHIKMRRDIFTTARNWLGEHGYDTERKSAKMFFEQLFLFVEADEFAVKKPSRNQLLMYMMRYTSLYWDSDRWGLRAMNAINTLAGPLVGYERFAAVYRAELRAMAALKRLRAGRS